MRIYFLLVFTALLTACGGGAGGDSTLSQTGITIQGRVVNNGLAPRPGLAAIGSGDSRRRRLSALLR